jgi:aspartyl-tRNA(Asn)/glutamyl-tRNA(Gln) amidotransferase subunit A
MTPLYDRFDVLLTASAAPAARLDTLLGSGFSDKWEKPNIYTPFSVSAGPALVVCNGYTQDGLPLAMQLVGRPFGETTVLNAGHAYERATDWRRRRPQLVPGAQAPTLTTPPLENIRVEIDGPTKAIVDAAIARAGLTLSETHRALLYRVAPPVLAAVNRIPRDRPQSDEPANMFGFAG